MPKSRCECIDIFLLKYNINYYYYYFSISYILGVKVLIFSLLHIAFI